MLLKLFLTQKNNCKYCHCLIVTAYTQQKGQNGSRDVQSPTVTSETTPVIDALPAVNNISENDVENSGKGVNNLKMKRLRKL